MTALNEPYDTHGHMHRRHDDDGDPPSDLLRDLKRIGIIAAVIGSAFTMGYNWREVTAVRTDLTAHIKSNEDDRRTYALREVVDGQNRDTQRQLEELKALIREVLNQQRLR